jgi:dipeptidase E
MLPDNRLTAYIPNAMDFATDLDRLTKSIKFDLGQLSDVGLDPEVLDLRGYFGRQKELEKKLNEYGAIWVRGGNTFVLRQSMRLSGFDKVFHSLRKKKNVLYGGYSAGVCILAPSLHGIELMDDPSQKPYGKRSKVIYEGLGALDYYVVPHYKSDHPETASAEKAVEYFIDHKLLFKVLHDGEVIIIE